MSTSLAERLKAARRRQFVGREAEQALFRSALDATELPFHLLYLFGIGGVGKTSLLREFADLCEQTKIPFIYLDARTIEPSPDSFMATLHVAMKLAPDDAPLQALAARGGRHVVLIDTYEQLVSLDAWMRDTFLPQLPEDTLVVLAGRRPPAPAWLADPGWTALLRPLALGNLSPQESQSYLSRRRLSLDQRQAALAFAQGHPLALALVADVVTQRPNLHLQPEALPDVLNTLLQRFLDHVPSAAHRAALEACAVARTMTEALLAEMLAMPDVYELFTWLRSLSFVAAGPFGLFPHDLARETLAADLRWRDPTSYALRERRAGAYYMRRLQQTRGWEQEQCLVDFIFLHRKSPAVRSLFETFEWKERSAVFIDAARDDDIPQLVAMVAQHEGEESARLAVHWLERQLQRAVVFREGAAGSKAPPVGFVQWIALHEAGIADLAADPATHSAWEYVQRHAPLRPGESALYRRFEMARESYQSASSIQSLNVIDWERHLLTTPALGPVFKTYADAAFWTPLLEYAEVPRMAGLDFEVGGRRYAVFGLDLRALPPLARLARLAQKFSAAPAAPSVAPPGPSRPLVVLDQQQFATAVRAALRSLWDLNALRNNPLLRSRLVAERIEADTPDDQRIAMLQATIQEAAEALQLMPRQARWYRALYYTYLHPAPTQEQAAELLDVPISTFRRHLRAGVLRVTESLWQREVGAVAK